MRFTTLIIMFVAVIAITATVTTIIIGGRTFDGTVVDKPYETGLAWDKTQKAREALGWKVTIQCNPAVVGKNTIRVDVLDRAGRPLQQGDVKIMVSRPSTRDYDRAYIASSIADGKYESAVDLPLYGNWSISIDVKNGPDQAVYSYPLYAQATHT